MKKSILALMIVMVILGGSIVVGAAAGSPGSDSDPVVTKSYVDSQIAAIKNNSGVGTTSDNFKAIQIPAGKKLIGKEGTEIVLRSGEAKAIDNGANGVSDMTSGKDLMSGYWIYLNHLLMTPKDDGRGIVASTDIWVMVRGNYVIQ